MTTQGEHAQTELAHELFAAAQLAPGEGIEDAVSRIAAALTAAPEVQAEQLHITHGPLMRHAAALLRSRKPVLPDHESVAAELELAVEGHPTPSGEPSAEWLEVMRIATTPAQPAAPQGVAYAELPMQFACSGVFPVYSADQMRAFADGTHALRTKSEASREFLERMLSAMEGVIDVADRQTDEFEALRSCVVDLTLMLFKPEALRASNGQAPASRITVEQVEDAVGLQSTAWDTIGAEKIVEAVLRLANGQAPAGATNTKTHALLSMMIGLFLRAKEKIGYQPGSAIDKTVAEAVEHLKDWPYPETATAQAAPAAFQRALDIRAAQGWKLGGNKVPVLYTDSINGEQVSRDDLWLCTTTALATEAPAAGAVAGPVEWPTTCDGKEQEAWETWAQTERYDMTQHPLHYLFLNERTYAARQGWKAGLLYAVEQMKAAAPTPAAQADSQTAPRWCSDCQQEVTRCVGDTRACVFNWSAAHSQADSVLEDAMGLVNDIDTHMRSEWSAGRLPAVCWPLAFSDRIKALRAARKQGAKHD